MDARGDGGYEVVCFARAVAEVARTWLTVEFARVPPARRLAEKNDDIRMV